MPIDPAHGRNIPAGQRIAALLRNSLDLCRTTAVSQVRNGMYPNLVPFLSQLYETLVPEYERFILYGARHSFSERRAIRAVTRTGIDLSRAWDLYLPEARQQAMRMSLNFVREFNSTTQQAIREAVATGIERGDPLSRVQRQLMGIPAENTIADRVAESPAFDRKRAYTIASTETSRAVHGGQASYGQSIGAAGLEWLASSDACPVCLSVNGKKVRYGEPFYIHTTGRPEYRMVYYPPMHPHCMCTVADWWDD